MPHGETNHRQGERVQNCGSKRGERDFPFLHIANKNGTKIKIILTAHGSIYLF